MKDDPTLSFQLVDQGQCYSSSISSWPLAELLTRRLKRIMTFVTKNISENNNHFNFEHTSPDNYQKSGLKLNVKTAIINMIIDVGLIYSRQDPELSALDLPKYSKMLQYDYNIQRSQFDDKKLERFINNLLVESQRMFKDYCFVFRKLPDKNISQ